MIISCGRRYIFVHIPKTGGTSMALALEARAMRDDIMLGDTPKALNRRRRLKDVETSGRLWKHSKLGDIYGLVGQQEIENFFIFTLIRNPWERMVSYYHWLKGQSFDHEAVKLAKAESFSGFLNHPHTMQSFHNEPYSSFVTDCQGQERCACYVRLEHLNEDIVPVEDHLGFGLDIPHENKGVRRGDWREFYSESDAEQLWNTCRDDIEKFGYSFDPASSRN